MKLIGCLKKSLLSEEDRNAVLEAHRGYQQNDSLTPEGAELAAVSEMLDVSVRDLRGVEAAIARAQSKVLQSPDQKLEADLKIEEEYVNLAGGLDVVPEISIDESHHSTIAGWFKGRLPTKVPGQTPRNARPSEQEAITKAMYGLRALQAPNFLFSSIRRLFVSDDGAHGTYRTSVQAIGFRGSFIEQSGARWDALRVGVVAHEIHHHLDSLGDGGFLSLNSPLFDIDLKSGPGIANMRNGAHGAIFGEAAKTVSSTGNEQLRMLLLYPLTIANRGFKRRDATDIMLAKMELFAQLGRVYFTNPDLMAGELPQAHALFEGFYEQARGIEDIREARDLLQRHLQRDSAAGRVRHDDDGAADSQAAGGAGVGQAGAGVGRGVRDIASGALRLEPTDRHGLVAPPKELVTEAPAGTPSFGTPVKGAITVVGVHYSNATGLVSLRGDKYGSAAAGAERSRVKWAGDERVKRRVYFYAQTSDAVPKSEGLVMGPHAYRVQLNNIYDMEADSLKLRDRYKTYGTNEFHNDTWVESQILDAGYDGYVVRSFNPSPAVVVLNKDVPVQYIGNKAKEKSLESLSIDARDRRGLVEVKSAKGAPKSDVGHRREAATGRYVGAPDWVGSSPQQLTVLRKKIRQLALEGEVGRYWYEQSSRAILQYFGGNKEDAERFVSLIAIYSPNNTVPGNTTAALQAWYQWKNGLPIHAAMRDADLKAVDLLVNGKVWSGVKTNSFYQNLMVEIDPSKLDPGVATMDMWMALAFDYGAKQVDQGPKYKFMERETRALADELGWSAHQVQAAIWTAMKGRIDPIRGEITKAELENGIGHMVARPPKDGKERKPVFKVKSDRWYDHYRLAHKMGMAAAANKQALAESAYDFSNALEQRSAQLSWEALPSSNVGKFPELFNAPIEQQMEYMVAIDAVFRNAQGGDRVAEYLGLPMTETMFNPSAWKSNVGIGGQNQVAISQPFKWKKKQDRPSQETIDLINTWARVRGLLLKQDGVYWHFPTYEANKDEHNGVRISFPFALSVEDTRALYQAIIDTAGRNDWAPAVNGNDVRVLNFSQFGDNPVDHATFRDTILRAVKTLPSRFLKAEFAGFRSDPRTEPPENDWTKDKNGEGYRRGISASRRPDVLGWAEATFADAIERVDQDFAKRYGWTRRGVETQGSAPREEAAEVGAKFSRAGQTSSPEFLAWFGDSKVVDENGRPLVVYHGTDTRFAVFDQAFAGAASGSSDGKAGFWFTSSIGRAALARRDAMSASGINDAPPVMRVYISLQNPLVLPSIEDMDPGEVLRLARRAKRQGHDGLLFQKGEDSAPDFVAFRPGQIKSATDNSGTFDPVNPDIRHSRASSAGNLSVAAVEEKVAAITSGWERKPDVTVLEAPYDAPFEVPSDARGAFYDGRIYLFASNLAGDIDVEFTLLHEAAGHLGLSGILGSDIGPVLEKIYDSNEIVRRLAGEQMAKYGYDQATATEEALADLAGSGAAADLSGWKMLLAALRNLLRKAGILIDMSDNDVMALLARARRYVERGGAADSASAFSKKGPIWYSELEAKVAGSMLKSAPPEQWRNTIKGMKGVKPDEIEWTGLNEWLSLQGKKVTKEQILDYLRENGVKVSETMLGERTLPHGVHLSPLHRGRYLMRAFTERGEGATLFDAAGALSARLDHVARQWQKHGDEEKAARFFATAEALDRWQESADGLGVQGEETKFSKHQLKGGKNYRELLLTLRPQNIDQVFGSSHFDTPNILAHIRFNERTDADGKRVLFVEEIQSDWGQKGRKHGFSDPGLPSNEDLIRTDRWLSQETSTIPAAPFVGKTESWVALSLKRMIRYAAENGFDRVAFVNGEQSADRYQLSKQVSEIQYDPERKLLKARDKYDNKVLEQVVEAEKLEDYIGKEAAKRLLESPINGRYHQIKGVDLKVGGEGMKTFYDQIVPGVAKDVLRKLGGPQLSSVRFDPDDLGLDPDDYPAGGVRQLGFDITEELQQKAVEGMPLFSRGTPEWAKNMPQGVQDSLRRVSVVNDRETLKDKMTRLFDGASTKLQQGLVDSFAPIKDISESAYMLARQSRGSDAGLEALLHYGKVGMSDEGGLTLDYEQGGVVKLLQQLGGNEESKRFFAWIAGVRAHGLKVQGRENNLTVTDISNLMHLNQGNMPDGSPRSMLYARVHKAFVAYQKSVLDVGEKAGLFSPGDRAIWEHDFYVPFYRVLEDEGYQGPHNVSGLVRQRAFQKLRGGKEKVDDLLQNTMRNWAHILAAATKNRAARETLDAAVNAPGGPLAAQIPAAQAGKKDPWIMVNGVKQYYHVDDPFLLEAISSLKPSPFTGALPDLMGKFKHALTYGVTFSPVFRINNLIRDTLSAVAVNPVSANIVRNLWEGGKGTKVGTEDYGKMLVSGALMHFGRANDESYANNLQRLLDKEPGATILDSDQKVMDAVKGALRWWEDTGSRVENINRVAIYQQTYARERANGATEGAARLRAAYAARDSMDFSSIGAWPAVRALAQVVPFLNARAQGLYKLGREGVAPTGRVIYNTVTGKPVDASDASKAFRFGAAATVVSAASIMALLAYGDDDDWKKREEFDRDNWWWFKFGDKSYRIPKPFELGSIGTVAERGVEMVMAGMDAQSRERFATRLWDIVSNTLSMNPVPQMFKPVLEIWANENSFTKRPIETMGMERLSPSQRIGNNTSAVAQLAGKAEVLSPVQIDHLIQGYFGWLGANAVKLVDVALHPAMGLPEKPAKRIEEVPVLGSFVRELPTTNSRFTTEFYKRSERPLQVKADIANLRGSGRVAEANDLQASSGEELAQARVFERAKRSMSEINAQIKRVRYGSGTPEERRERIDQLTQRRNEVARAALLAVGVR